jgi:predicted nicotinamide N-methyase
VNPQERPLERTLAALPSRSVSVEVDPGLRFTLTEVLYQPRPAHWARVWPSSVALARWLRSLPQAGLPSSARELGCGLGLVSLTLAHLGVSVQATDRQPTALAFAAHNAHRNGQAALLTALLDWASPSGAASPMLLGSDILYDADAPAQLLALVHHAGLLAAGGMLVLGGPAARPFLLDQLVGGLVGLGYRHGVLPLVVPWEDVDERIDVHTLVRPA